jgi:hypothetical protein
VPCLGDEFPPFRDHHCEKGREQPDGAFVAPTCGIVSWSVHDCLCIVCAARRIAMRGDFPVARFGHCDIS